MSNLFDEIADTMAASFTVGRHVSREEILAAMHAKYKTEDELRAAMAIAHAKVRQAVEQIEAEGGIVVAIAQVVSVNRNPSNDP